MVITRIYFIIEGTAKARPVPAFRQAVARTRLARSIRAKRDVSAVPPLSQDVRRYSAVIWPDTSSEVTLKAVYISRAANPTP